MKDVYAQLVVQKKKKKKFGQKKFFFYKKKQKKIKPFLNQKKIFYKNLK